MKKKILLENQIVSTYSKGRGSISSSREFAAVAVVAAVVVAVSGSSPATVADCFYRPAGKERIKSGKINIRKVIGTGLISGVHSRNNV